jgi:protein-L-isoaspartate O-methyltransferase
VTCNPAVLLFQAAEVAELAKRSFEVIGIDYTAAAVAKTRALLETQALKAEVVQADVLSYKPEKKFDAIYEQTCLCAIHPEHWFKYSESAAPRAVLGVA